MLTHAQKEAPNELAEREKAEWRWEIESSCGGKHIKITINNQAFFTLNVMKFQNITLLGH